MARAKRDELAIEAGRRYRELRRLRLGLSAEEGAKLALEAGVARPHFNGRAISRFEGDGTGIGSRTRFPELAAAVGLTERDLDAYLRGTITVAEAERRSTVAPNKTKAAEFAAEDAVAATAASRPDPRDQRIAELEEQLRTYRGLLDDLMRERDEALGERAPRTARRPSAGPRAEGRRTKLQK